MTQTAHQSARAHSAGFTDKQRKIALTIVALAFVMDLLDNTIVNIAIPTIQANLGASYSAIQWLIAGYSLSFALLLITGGRMGDVFGYKKLFLTGVAGFTVASLLCGVAMNPSMLVVARILQGGMAALMVPQVLSLMQVMYKPEERGAVNGVFGALGGLAASLGPVIGGILIKANVGGLDWRPIFLINIPVGIFAFVAGMRFLPNGKSDHPLKLDLIGTAIILIAMTLLIYPLIQGRELGWPTWTYAMVAASIPVFLIFAYWLRIKDRRDGSALLVPSLFRNKVFVSGLLINLVFEGAMLSFFLTFTLVIQVGLGFSPLHAALTGLPTAVGIAVTMAVFAEKIMPKLGRNAIFLGTAIMATGLWLVRWLFVHYGTALHSWQLIPALLLVGIGMAFMFASLFAAVLNGVDSKHAGSVSGTLNAVQQVGGAIGIALIGVIFFSHITNSAASSFSAVTPQISRELTAAGVPAQTQTAIIASAQQCYLDRAAEQDSAAVPASCKQAEQGGNPQIGDIMQRAAVKANDANFNRGFTAAIIFASCILAVVFGLTFLLPKHFRPETYQEA